MPSSVIAAMHYDEHTRVLTMIYQGKRGVYRYLGVPPEEWADFQAAPSKGAYLNEVFKKRNYRYEKVGACATHVKDAPVDVQRGSSL